MDVVGYAAGALIGVSLGLIGGGGSILTVPVLVYLFGLPASSAAAHSLFVVGVTSLVGAALRARRGLVDFPTALAFAPPALMAVYTTRRYLMPLLPDRLASIGGFDLTRDRALLLLLALLMLGTARSMIRSTARSMAWAEAGAPAGDPDRSGRGDYGKVVVSGLIVGVISGLVGAGGGFLILPALILLMRVPVPRAVGTSLLIIAVNSGFGLLGDLQAHTRFAWPLLLGLTATAILGILAGSFLARFIPGASLKPAFGWFLVAMAVYLVGRELLPAAAAPPHHHLASLSAGRPTASAAEPMIPLRPLNPSARGRTLSC
jgi:uncharacterized membrane protein YfcA